MLSRQRALVTPRGRAIITRKMAAKGHWVGTRRGIKIGLRYSSVVVSGQGIRRAARLIQVVKWQAKIGGQWVEGQQETVFDAIAEIERKAAE